MNLLITLFGGMILTAAIYGLGRLARLSNFWAAVTGCALPSFAYLAYASAFWPGLDRVTMHVVAYPTVAVLLYQLYGARARHAESMHWAPKLMVGFFLALSVVYGSFIYIASQGLPPWLAEWLLPETQGRVHTGFAGVVEHRQEAAKGIAYRLKNEDMLARQGWRLEISGLREVSAGQPIPVGVLLRDRLGDGVAGVKIDLALARPGQPTAVVTPLPGGAAGYHATLAPVERGTWIAYLTLEGPDKPIKLEYTLEVR